MLLALASAVFLNIGMLLLPVGGSGEISSLQLPWLQAR
jgi:hypothetical protein